MIAEWILRRTAKPMAEARKDPSAEHPRLGSLATLRDSFPHFFRTIAAARVLDYGCGYGDQARAMGYHSAHEVVGFDVSPAALEKAREGNRWNNVTFTDDLAVIAPFDIVVCQNSFEHFLTPESEMARMLSVTKPGGCLLLTFGPPWRSPWGAHMDAWCRLPWIQNWPLNLFFTEDIVMRVRQTFRTDAAGPKSTYRSVGLGKMTVEKFEALIEKFGLTVVYRRYTCCWGFDWLQRIPVIREWFINHISVSVVK